MEKVSIIIPAYNEEKRIAETLEENLRFFRKIKAQHILDFEIIVVVNGSSDRTIDIVKYCASKNKEVKYMNLSKGAKGYAVMEGFKRVLKGNSEFIGFKDADMSTKPKEFYGLIKKIGNYDGTIASRYMKGSIIEPKPTLARVIAKNLFNYFIRTILLLPYRDTQCGAKVFKRKALEQVIPMVTFSLWAFDVDLLYSLRKKGFKIKEIPTIWSDEEYSTINFWSSGPMMALAIIRLRILNSPFKSLISLYDKFITKFIWRKK